jgi:hypothetical protein
LHKVIAKLRRRGTRQIYARGKVRGLGGGSSQYHGVPHKLSPISDKSDHAVFVLGASTVLIDA